MHKDGAGPPAPFFDYRAKEPTHGFQQYHVPAGVSAAGGHPVLHLPQKAAQRAAAGVQPAVLRLGRAKIYPHHAVLHGVRLLQRSGHRTFPRCGKAQGRQGGAGGVRGGQPEHSGILQVYGFCHHQSQRSAGYGYPRAGAAAAHRHLVLHVPDHELHHRRVPGTGAAPAEHHRFQRLCDAVPSAHRGAHRPVQDGGRRSGEPEPRVAGRGQRRYAAVRHRPGQEGAAGQPDGRRVGGDRGHVRALRGHGVAGGAGIYVPDLFRFLRLFRYGHRPGQAVRLPVSGELQLSL